MRRGNCNTELLFSKLFHLINQHIQMFTPPRVGSDAHLVTQIVEELGLLWNLFPDLRKERSAADSIKQDHPVNVWTQFREQILSVFVFESFRDRETGNLDFDLIQL